MRIDDVLTTEALAFLAELGGALRGRARRARSCVAPSARSACARGSSPASSRRRLSVREGDWLVAPPPAEIADRRVEITGPVDRKMVINALNSGARVFMADFEDANAPTWANVIQGQRNLSDALDRTIELVTPDRTYRLGEAPAVLFVRPRGWHLAERHHEVDGRPMSASLFDFGLYALRNHARGGRYLYLPKLESHLEARLWNDVLAWTEDRLGLERGFFRATVLIETILAAFEMDEILYELRDHSAGLNAGRWDYIFSVIKKLGHRPEFVLPDRAAVTMAVPFMRSYCELLVRDLSPARDVRDGRDGGLHPVAPRPRGQRHRTGEGDGGQAARGLAGLRRDLGRPPRPRPRRTGVLRRGAGRAPQPDRPSARRRARDRRRAARRRRDAR